MVPAIFDYGTVPADVAAALRGQAERIRLRIANGTTDMLETGRDLLAAKASVKHGEFSRWVEAELGITVRSAQTMMRAAEIAASESEKFSLLPPSVALKLAAPSVPLEVRSAFVERAAKGERVPIAAVSAELRRLRDEREEAAHQAKLDARTPAAKAAERRRRKEQAERERLRDEECRLDKERRKSLARGVAEILRGRLTAEEWETVLAATFGDGPHMGMIRDAMTINIFCDPGLDGYLPPAYRAHDSIDAACLAEENRRLREILASDEEHHARRKHRRKSAADGLARLLAERLPPECREAAADLLIDIDGDAGLTLLEPAPAPSIVPAPADDDDVPYDFSKPIGAQAT